MHIPLTPTPQYPSTPTHRHTGTPTLQHSFRLILLLALTSLPAQAQFVEDFDDGELANDPTWTGTLDRWQFLPAGNGLALFSDGLAQSDTLYLTTASDVTNGSWSFDIGYRNGLLSNFNLMRILLMAGSADLDQPVDGYYLQIGTNERDVRLYRSDAGGSRSLILQHASDLLLLEPQAISIEIKRSADRTWTLYIDGQVVDSAQEEGNTILSSQFFGLWIKHTTSRNQDFWFDNIVVDPDTSSNIVQPPARYRLPEPGDLIVNEIYYAPPQNDLEFVEIFNVSPDTLDLCDVSIADNTADPISICSGSHPVVPGGYGVTARDSIALNSAFPTIEPLSPFSWPALNNSGDSVRLLSGETLLEEVSYVSSWGGQGVSLERRDPAGPTESPFNWGSSLDPAGASPGRQNSLFARDTSPPQMIFAELTSLITIMAIWNEAIEVPPASSFRVGNLRPESVEQLDASTLLLHFDVDIDAQELTAAGITDLTGNIQTEDRFPLAFPPSRGELVINEIMYEPRADPFDRFPDQPEYVELFNPSNRRLSLRSLTLTGQVDEAGATDSLRSDIPYPILEPDGYAVFYAAASDPGASSLFDAFPSLSASSSPYSLLPIEASSLRLTNSGGFIRISTSKEPILDETIYSPDWHHPNLDETRGIALERRTGNVDSFIQDNWSSSASPEGGTPGQPNSIRFKQTSSETPSSTLQLDPNPFSPNSDGLDDVLAINLTFDTAPRLVSLRIFDARGRLVRTLSAGTLAGSTSNYFWDGHSEDARLLPPGIYIVFVEILDIDRGKRERLKETVVLAW